MDAAGDRANGVRAIGAAVESRETVALAWKVAGAVDTSLGFDAHVAGGTAPPDSAVALVIVVAHAVVVTGGRAEGGCAVGASPLRLAAAITGDPRRSTDRMRGAIRTDADHVVSVVGASAGALALGTAYRIGAIWVRWPPAIVAAARVWPDALFVLSTVLLADGRGAVGPRPSVKAAAEIGSDARAAIQAR